MGSPRFSYWPGLTQGLLIVEETAGQPFRAVIFVDRAIHEAQGAGQPLKITLMGFLQGGFHAHASLLAPNRIQRGTVALNGEQPRIEIVLGGKQGIGGEGLCRHLALQGNDGRPQLFQQGVFCPADLVHAQRQRPHQASLPVPCSCRKPCIQDTRPNMTFCATTHPSQNQGRLRRPRYSSPP